MILVKENALRLRALFQGDKLKARAARATLLLFGAFGIAKFLQLATNLVVTRLLFPEAFGLMALVQIYLTGLELMSDVGIKASVIRSQRSEDPVFQATAWTLQIVRGGWVTSAALLLAWPYSQLYGEPILFPLILVVAVTPLISGFYSIEASMMERRLTLGRVVTMQILGRLITSAVMIFFAWAFASVWGLAVGTVVGAALITAFSHVVMRSANHRIVWDREVLGEIMVFGRWVLVATMFTFLGTQGLQAVRGYLVDLDVLAFLHIAMMFALIITGLMQKIMSKVGYSAIAETVRTRPRQVKRMAAKIRALQTMVSTPGFLMLAAVGPWLIGVLYDPRYAEAGSYLTLLALANAIAVLPLVYQKTLLALGDSRTHAAVTGTASALRIAAVFLGFWAGGVVGMLLADAVALLVVFALSAAIARRRGYATLRIDLLNLAAIGIGYAVLVPPYF